MRADKSKKNKAVQSRQDAELKREVVAFKLVVEREIDST